MRANELYLKECAQSLWIGCGFVGLWIRFVAMIFVLTFVGYGGLRRLWRMVMLGGKPFPLVIYTVSLILYWSYVGVELQYFLR